MKTTCICWVAMACILLAGCQGGTPVTVTRASTAEKMTRNYDYISNPRPTPPSKPNVPSASLPKPFTPPPQPTPDADPGERRLALVIGNSAYPGGAYLRNPVNDAKGMSQALKKLRFAVMETLDADQKQMKMTIDRFGSRLKGYEVGLVYYAGHGIQVDGRNYLIPIDAQLKNKKQVEYDGIDAERILMNMEDSGSRVNIVILDACRDNPFERSWSRGIKKKKGLAQMNAPHGSLIAYSTSPGSTAADGEGMNGLYTSALLKYIRTPNLSIESVFKKVRTTVMARSDGAQTPWELSSLTGDFYFKIKK